MGFDSATLSGQVKVPESAGSGHWVTAARIALFPRDHQSPFLIERRANADSAGNFVLKGVAPGAYTVFAFPAVQSAEWQDPEVRRRLLGHGKSVDLRAGGKETVELVLAPQTGEP